MIAITGATGQLGQLIVESLLKKVPAGQLVAVVRNAGKAAGLKAKGVAVRVADYTDPAALTAALAGVKTLVMVSSSEVGQRAEHHRNVIAAAKANKVGLVVYTSLLHADVSGISLAEEHRGTEADLRASGLAYIILRNGWYFENYTGDLSNALTHGVIPGAAGAGRISAASRADLAEAAAIAATGGAKVGQVYELAGDEGFTLAELAAEVARQSGKPVAYNNLPEADYAALLGSFGLPEQVAKMIAGWDVEIAKGALEDHSKDLSKLIGRPTTSLRDAVKAALAK